MENPGVPVAVASVGLVGQSAPLHGETRLPEGQSDPTHCVVDS